LGDGPKIRFWHDNWCED
jgi:hypothetical protein